MVLGMTLFRLGEVLPARTHLEQGTALYDPTQHHAQAFLYAADPGVILLCYAARAGWAIQPKPWSGAKRRSPLLTSCRTPLVRRMP